MPAANMMSMVTFDRRPKACADPRRLLEGIHRQSEELVRPGRLELALPFMMRAVKAATGGLTWMTKADRCWATCVLSMMGRIVDTVPPQIQETYADLEGVRLESVDLLGPLFPRTCSFFTVFELDGRTCVTLHYDPRVIDESQAADLLDTFLQNVRRSLEAGRPSGALT